MTSEIIKQLETIATACVDYVGSANYQSRHNAALDALSRAFAAAKKGDLEELLNVKIVSRSDGQYHPSTR